MLPSDYPNYYDVPEVIRVSSLDTIYVAINCSSQKLNINLQNYKKHFMYIVLFEVYQF